MGRIKCGRYLEGKQLEGDGAGGQEGKGCGGSEPGPERDDGGLKAALEERESCFLSEPSNVAVLRRAGVTHWTFNLLLL